MPPPAIRLSDKLGRITEPWRPGVIAGLNDYEVKLAKIKGEFIWHRHEDTDELFLCLQGNMSIDFEDGSVNLEAGELLVVPRGVMHRPWAHNESHVLLIEPAGVVNTGDAKPSALTAPGNHWL